MTGCKISLEKTDPFELHSKGVFNQISYKIAWMFEFLKL